MFVCVCVQAMLLCRQVNESTQRQQLYVSRVMDALAEFRSEGIVMVITGSDSLQGQMLQQQIQSI